MRSEGLLSTAEAPGDLGPRRRRTPAVSVRWPPRRQGQSATAHSRLEHGVRLDIALAKAVPVGAAPCATAAPLQAVQLRTPWRLRGTLSLQADHGEASFKAPGRGQLRLPASCCVGHCRATLSPPAPLLAHLSRISRSPGARVPLRADGVGIVVHRLRNDLVSQNVRLIMPPLRA